jgi:hypothetical protein
VAVKKWLKRIRGAVGMGLTWAVGWGIFGLMIGVASILLPWLPWDAFFEVFDAPLPALAVPGLVGGALFSVVLGIAGRRRRFDELSLPRFAAWGAAGGLLLSMVPDVMVAVGLASFNNPDARLWRLTALISGPLMLLGAASAAGSLWLARRAADRASPEALENAAEMGLSDDEKRELLGPGTEPASTLQPRARESVRVTNRRD